MANERPKPPVRTRTRVIGKGDGQRLIADPAPARHRQREPNAGSMKKGETRNPNGRPKGVKGSKATVRKMLSQKTTIREGGKTRKVTLFDALLHKELEAAFAGDWRARRTILELGRWALPEESPGTALAMPTIANQTDEAILAWFESEVLARHKQEEES